MTLYISPNRRLSNLRQAMDRLFEEEYDQTPNEREMALALDVQVEDEAYTVRALVPGLKADDLTIEILNNTITIRGEFKAEEKENVRFLMNELPQGRFSRVITLPTALDPGKAEANIKDGSRIVAMSFCEPRSCIGRLSS